MSPASRTDRRRPGPDWAVFAVLVLTVLVLYGRTIAFGFVRADDADLILGNARFLESPGNLPLVFLRSYFEVEGELTDLATYYRPLVVASFVMDASLGGVSPGWFHATNVALHLAVVVLLFGLLRDLGAPRGAALLVTAMFAVHPVNVQAVAWIVGRNDVLLGAFVLIGLRALHRHADVGSRGAGVVFLLAFGLALLTKESAIVWLVVAPLFLVLWENRPWRWREHQKPAALVLGVAALWTVLRAWVLAGGDGGPSIGARLAVGLTSLPDLLLYVGKAVLPVRLSVMPSLDATGAAIGVASLVLIGLALRGRLPVPRLAFAAAWAVLFLVPALFAGDLPAYEHRAYVPLLGLAMVLATADWGRRRTLATTVGAAIVLVFAVLTAQHLRVFDNPFAYWESATAGTRYAPLAHVNLGRLHEELNQLDRAIREYQRALELDPRTPKARNNLGVVLTKLGDYEGAERHFAREIELFPGNAEAQFNLGLCYKLTNRRELAAERWRRAIEANRYFLPAYRELEAYHRQRGEEEEAERYRVRAASLAERSSR